MSNVHIPKDHMVKMPDGNTYYVIQVFAIRHACRLEAAGMKASSGRRTACSVARKMLGLPKNKPRQEVADMMEEVVRQIKEQQT